MISANLIKKIVSELGADAVGLVRPASVERRDEFLTWLDAGYAGEMVYLHKFQSQRFDPRKLLPGAKSIIVIGVNYWQDEPRRPARRLKVARYARRKDYHQVLRKILKRLRALLKEHTPGLGGRICVDTAPFMDKYWAQKAGLGWQGKHTNLVSRTFGSWLLLGSLIITEEVDVYDRPGIDHCGRCRRCVEACPTGALFEPYRLDATRCISYWTIESKAAEIPENIAGRMGGWVFGCDICLDVCPFNRFRKPGELPALVRDKNIALIEEDKIEELDPARFNALLGATPLSRAGLEGLKKNRRAFE